MDHRQTAAYPPSPASPSSTETLVADPPAVAVTQDGTLWAESPPVGGAERAPLRPSTTPTRAPSTVLPDVRNEGEQLIVVPREQLRYQGNQLLGRGGMGEVKLAHDHDIDRRVAVKRLLDRDNPQAVARFIDEVRTVGRLEHPNIVPIHDVGVDDQGALFFVMKYVEGQTLAEIIAALAAGDAETHERFGFEARLDLFAGLLRALHYAHSRGLVHRDIKPENIMVGPYGEVMLMDWGVAHQMRGTQRHPSLPTDFARASSETVDGAVVGTPQYMSPEQAAGEVEQLDGRSDLYSAYTVLWELLTLHPYVEVAPGDSAMQTILSVQSRPAPSIFDPLFSPHPGQPSVPVELRHFLVHGLARDKGERPESAGDVLADLERLRAGEFAISCPVTFVKRHNTRLLRLIDRRPMASLVLVMIALMALFGGVAGWVAWAVA